ncbi:MAG: Histidine--tRNA ligase [Chlamydiae bacterium]|nr:Histidine--tRNA ligase [Chlamydiota bacterium]
MKYQIPPGVFDILPEDSKELWRCSHIWNYVESVIRQIALEFGYREIRTPVFEKADLFLRSVGETTDIVSKEMYLFQDKGERLLALRPEGTAPVMRAFIEHGLLNQGQNQKFFYIGPMFRYNRPQAGRYRQHHQFGIEAIGNRSPGQDVEVIAVLYSLLQRLGMNGLDVQINCIGDKSVRDKFEESLKSYLQPHLTELSQDSQKRFETNPLRILDSKEPQDIKIVKNAPPILDFITEENQQHFEKVKDLLTAIGIPFSVNPLLVRGLDYYNEMVFEVMTSGLGAQSSLGGGGRYDGLLKMMGGPDIPASGFGSGIERIIQAMIHQKCSIPEEHRPMVFIIPIGEAASSYSFKLLHQLRDNGISAQMDYTGRKVGKAMQLANQVKARHVLVIGDNELESGMADLKDMDAGTSDKVNLESLVMKRILEEDTTKE